MNIYRLWQEVNNEYDTYDSMVVIASNETEAKSYHPSGGTTQETLDGWDSWCSLEDVQIELLGKASKKQKAGIVTASYNAG